MQMKQWFLQYQAVYNISLNDIIQRLNLKVQLGLDAASNISWSYAYSQKVNTEPMRRVHTIFSVFER